jgi:hypothetical protein
MSDDLFNLLKIHNLPECLAALIREQIKDAYEAGRRDHSREVKNVQFYLVSVIKELERRLRDSDAFFAEVDRLKQLARERGQA